MLLNRMKALPPSEYLRFQCDPQQKSRGSSQHKRIKWCLQHVDTISQISWPRSANSWYYPQSQHCTLHLLEHHINSWYDVPREMQSALLRLRIRLSSTVQPSFFPK
jgi:hypothetical protein